MSDIKIGDIVVYHHNKLLGDEDEIWVVTDIIDKSCPDLDITRHPYGAAKVHIISSVKDDNGDDCLNVSLNIIKADPP